MAAGQQAFLSTPTFELFRRGLLVQTIQRFHGINAFSSLPLLSPDWAQDLNNVIVSGSGSLQKFRRPVVISGSPAYAQQSLQVASTSGSISGGATIVQVITSNVPIIPLQNGQVYQFSGFTNATWLNGLLFTVQFFAPVPGGFLINGTAPFNHAAWGSTAEVSAVGSLPASSGPNSFWDFQQGNGLRQVIAQFGQSLFYYSNDLATITLIENSNLNSGQWDFVEANNILFGANGQRMRKWLGSPPAAGSTWQPWGIQPAAAPPSVNTNLSNAQNLTGVTLNGSTGYISTSVQQTPAPKVFTFEIWIKTTTNTWGGIFESNSNQTGNGGARRDRTLWINPTGQLNFGVYDDTTSSPQSIGTAQAYNDGKWHQVVVTLDGSKVAQIFVDGALASSSLGPISPDPIEAFNEYWRIGEAQGNGGGWPFTNAFFAGTVSHASIWKNQVWAAADIANRYQTLTTQGQAAYEALVLSQHPSFAWFLTETSGTVAADHSDGNTGTYQGTVTLNVTAAAGGGLSPTFGYEYGYAWMNSTTEHVGNISPASGSSGPVANVTFVAQAAAPNPPDDQLDTIVWFRTEDGGGDLFRLCSALIATGDVTLYGTGANLSVQQINGQYLQLTDVSPDTALDTTTQGPLINNPPVQGKYLATGQSRVFVFNLEGAPQDAIYSGYEQILVGRPEESFPPNNRLRLAIGAEAIAGGGVLHAGVVAFSETGRMYMMRGAVEDISLDVPIAFTSYLEELPWTLGCFSHFSIKATPYGLIWLAGDKTVQLFDGHNPPVDISQGIYPYLRRITPGTESQVVASYYNWLDRDWYTLLVSVDGSLTPNRLFTFALNINRSQGLNTIESVEAFISDVPNVLSGGVSWVGLLTNSKRQRMLCVGSGGFIQQLPVSPDTQNGITEDYTINPATNGMLNAFWKGGYSGNDSPQRSKMWRWARLVTDQGNGSFHIKTYMVDDERRKFTNPEILGPMKVEGRTGINNRAKRCAVEIVFPPQDAPANVLELQIAQVPTADR